MFPEATKQRLLLKFKSDTTRQLALLRSNLTWLNQAPGTAASKETLKAMFINCHTIKGNLGMIKLLNDEDLRVDETAGYLESTVLALFEGNLILGPDIIINLDKGIRKIELEFSK